MVQGPGVDKSKAPLLPRPEEVQGSSYQKLQEPCWGQETSQTKARGSEGAGGADSPTSLSSLHPKPSSGQSQPEARGHTGQPSGSGAGGERWRVDLWVANRR